MRINQRLALLGIGVTLGLGLVLALVSLVVDFRRHEREFDDTNLHIIDLITPSATRAIRVLDYELASEVISGLMHYDFITYAKVERQTGLVLAMDSKEVLDDGALNWSQRLIGERYRNYSANLVAESSDRTISGKVVYRVDLIKVYDSLYKSVITHLAGDLFLSFLLIAALYLTFYGFFTRPVLRLAQEMKAINVYKPSSKRFTTLAARSDELSQLVDNGNRLLESVELALNSQRSIEGVLRKSEEHLRALIDCLPVYVSARNRAGEIVFVNKAWASVFNYSPEQLQKVKLKDILSVRCVDIDRILSRDLQVLDLVGDHFIVEEEWFGGSNETLFWQSHYSLFQFHDEDVVLVVSTDISDRKKAESHVAFMAYHDSLTRLPNRIQLVDRLENELSRANRHGEYGAVLFIDLDKFKAINDSLGHPVGDFLLVEIARRLENAVREEDMVARIGGDEFVLVLTQVDKNLQEARSRVEKIGDKVRRCIAEPVYHDSIELRITCSIGAVIFPIEGVSVHDLLRYADTAMYQVKENGRNSFSFFNEHMKEVVEKQLVLEAELHHALEDHQFELLYQPKVDVQSGELKGAEALLRWNHPLRGIVAPNDFIGTLESSGLIVQVGHWVVKEACRALLSWQQEELWQEGMLLSVNVSPRQFRHNHFVEGIKTTLDEFSVQHESLELEITENVVIGSVSETTRIMSELCELGIRFSLDDFGTGYSSISYLKNLPVSTLKIDQSFVRDIGIDSNDKVLVESMATMGRLLGLKVIAEGVEHQEQLQLIKEFGCEEYQGFYFSKPISADEFLHMLK